MEHADERIIQPDVVPYIVFEGEQVRNERHIKRLWIAVIIAVILLALSNALWLWAWMQYDYTSEDIEIDSGNGVANYVGRDGDINNGKDTGET